MRMNMSNYNQLDSIQLSDKLINYCILENTHMIFDFMEELDKITYHENNIYNEFAGLVRRQEILESLINGQPNNLNKSIENAFDSKNCILNNNLIGKYINYWNVYFYNDPIAKNNLQKNSLFVLMYHLYRVVMTIDGLEKTDDAIPYLYEDLCITIANMTGYKMCYLLFREGNFGDYTLLSKSGYVIYDNIDAKDIFITEIQNPDFDKLLNNKTNEGSNDNHILNSVITSENNRHILIDLPMYYGEENKDKKHFYIFLSSSSNLGESKESISQNDNNSDDYCIYTLSKILFLRDMILNILTKNYGELIDNRWKYEYLKKIYNNDHSTIMHISDIHVENDSTWNSIGIKTSYFINALKTIKSKSNTSENNNSDANANSKRKFSIELLAISGDVINFSTSASVACEKYKKAAKIIYRIAYALWGEPDEKNIIRLPHDWKKRIMICPGNHDYLSMNELISSSTSRMTKSGAPDIIHNENSLVKYTYFINFLIEYFDIPYSIVYNDLNEMRFYKNLGVKALILNSCSKANVYQNNKVGFKSDIVKKLITNFNKIGEKADPICVVHHGPLYEIDYLEDIYEKWNYDKCFNNDKQLGNLWEKVYAEFHESVKIIYNINSNSEEKNALIVFIECKIKNDLDNVDNILKTDNLNENKKRLCNDAKTLQSFFDNFKELKAKINCILQNQKDNDVSFDAFLKSSVFYDMNEIYSCLSNCIKNYNNQKSILINEFYLNVINKILDSDKMSLFDQKQFIEDVSNIFNENILFLSGHLHENHCYPLSKKERPKYLEKMDDGDEIKTIKEKWSTINDHLLTKLYSNNCYSFSVEYLTENAESPKQNGGKIRDLYFSAIYKDGEKYYMDVFKENNDDMPNEPNKPDEKNNTNGKRESDEASKPE